MEVSDRELLAKFHKNRSEDAFRALVDRHLPMVFGVAHRVTGNAAIAEEIAQSTFSKLAQSTVATSDEVVVGGWLYNTARNAAMSLARSERNRREREKLSAEMNTTNPEPEIVAEHLERAMSQLNDADRNALVLRFFEDRNLREVGVELGVGEDAARMRVNRALEKLKTTFGKLGITGSTAWLATALPSGASAAVPSGLSASITTTVLTSGVLTGAAATIATETATNSMSIFLNLKTTAAIVAIAAVTGTSTYMVKENQLETLESDLTSLNEAYVQLAGKQAVAVGAIEFRDQRIQTLEQDVTDIHRLRGEVDRLNRELEALAVVAAENQRLEAELEKLNSQIQGRISEQIADEEGKKLLVTKVHKLSVDSATQRLADMGLASDQQTAFGWPMS